MVAALDNDRLIAEVVRRSDGSQVLSAYHQTIAGIFGAVVIAVRKLHGLRPFGRVGQSGNRHIILAGGNTRQHRCEIQRDNVTFYAKFVRNMVSQFNVRTHIFLVPLLGGVDEFHGSKIGFCDHFDITALLDGFQPVGSRGLLLGRASCQRQCQTERQT